MEMLAASPCAELNKGSTTSIYALSQNKEAKP